MHLHQCTGITGIPGKYIGQGYNRNAARLILAEVQRKLGQTAVDELINELNMQQVFGFNPGQAYKAP